MMTLYAFLAKAVLFGLCRTTRFEEKNTQYVRDYIFQKKPDRGGVIFTFWHNRLFYMTYFFATKYVRLGHKVVVFSSYSKDGEIMARLETSLGAAVVRGSTSKGAIEGLINLYRKALTGFSPVITPDGPRGPKYEVQDGLLFLAQKTSFPVIPISCTPDKSYRFNSWDNFMVPLPFSRVEVIYGEPIVADATLSREELRKQIKDGLMKITVD